jgi:hypothetical protein
LTNSIGFLFAQIKSGFGDPVGFPCFEKNHIQDKTSPVYPGCSIELNYLSNVSSRIGARMDLNGQTYEEPNTEYSIKTRQHNSEITSSDTHNDPWRNSWSNDQCPKMKRYNQWKTSFEMNENCWLFRNISFSRNDFFEIKLVFTPLCRCCPS